MKMQDRYSIETIKQYLLDRAWQCWCYVPKKETIKCVLLTQIIQFPAGHRTLVIHLAGGEGMEYWLGEFWDGVKDYAKENQCEDIQFQGRKGWKRVMERIEPDLKTKPLYTVAL